MSVIDRTNSPGSPAREKTGSPAPRSSLTQALKRSDLIRLGLTVLGVGVIVCVLVLSDSKKDIADVLITVSAVLASTATAGLITGRILKGEERQEIQQDLTRLLSDPTNELHLRLLFDDNAQAQKQGFARVVANHHAIQIPKLAGTGGGFTDLLILGFDVGDILRHPDLVERLEDPMHRLRLLLLDPECPLAAIRGETLEYDDYPARLRTSLSSLSHHLGSAKPVPHYEIRLYRDIPSILSVMTEYSVWFTPLWNHGNNKLLPVCEIQRTPQSLLYEHLSRNFDFLWERGQRYGKSTLAPVAGSAVAKTGEDGHSAENP